MDVDDLQSMKTNALKCAEMLKDIDKEQAAWQRGYARAATEILDEIRDGFLTLVTHD